MNKKTAKLKVRHVKAGCANWCHVANTKCPFTTLEKAESMSNGSRRMAASSSTDVQQQVLHLSATNTQEKALPGGDTTVGHAWTFHLHWEEVVDDSYGRLPTAVMEESTCQPDFLSEEIYSFLGILIMDAVDRLLRLVQPSDCFPMLLHRHQWNCQERLKSLI